MFEALPEINHAPVRQHDGWRALVLILSLAGLVAAACALYPARLPFWAPWDFSPSEFLVTAIGLWAYGRGLALTSPALRPSRSRRALFLTGTTLTYAVLQTHFDYMAQHMFTLTRVQHLITHHLGPFLIALSWPGAVLLRGLPAPLRRMTTAPVMLRALDVLQRPVLAGLLFVGLLFLWLVPPVQFRAMINTRLYAVMNWSMVVDGLLFWCLILDPRPAPAARLSFSLRLLLVLGVQFPQIVGGAAIVFAGSVLYPYYALCGRIFPAITDRVDQQIGGFLIMFGGGMMSAVAVLWLLGAMWKAEQRDRSAAASA